MAINNRYGKLDGKYYGSHISSQCNDFHRCRMCGACSSFSANRQKCVECHSNKSTPCGCRENTEAAHNYISRKLKTDAVVPDRKPKDVIHSKPPELPKGISVSRDD